MKTLILASALVLGLGTAAYAADAVVEDVVVVDNAYNWSGVYVGAQVGYGWGDGHTVYVEGADYTWPTDPDGILGGVYAGYNYQFTNGLVLGVETEFNANGGSDSSESYYAGVIYPDYWQGDLDLKWSGSTRARVGYAMDRWLPFVTAGVAYAGYDFTTHYEGSVWDEGGGTLVGWTLGGGAEYALTDNWRVRASYLYTDYGSDTFAADYPGGDPSGYSYDTDLKTHTVALGVSFNW